MEAPLIDEPTTIWQTPESPKQKSASPKLVMHSAIESNV
jgi:hypothetical protein